MGLLDRIANFLFGPTGEARAKEIEEREPGEEVSKDIVFQRKILKSAFSERRGRKVINIFALTFEDNFTDRFNELEQEIRSYADSNNLFFSGREFGYDDQQTTTNLLGRPVFPEIEVGEE